MEEAHPAKTKMNVLHAIRRDNPEGSNPLRTSVSHSEVKFPWKRNWLGFVSQFLPSQQSPHVCRKQDFQPTSQLTEKLKKATAQELQKYLSQVMYENVEVEGCFNFENEVQKRMLTKKRKRKKM
jgi:hypothetical protein